MSPSQNTHSNAEFQQQNNSVENFLRQKVESLSKEVKSLKRLNLLNSGVIGLGVIGFIGYVVATNWSTIASALVIAGTATAAGAPIIGIVLGAIVGAAVLVGASYAIWKYRAQIKEGFKYAADKTVEGAKYTAGKIKDGAVHVKNKVQEGYEYSVNSLERGAKNAADRLGDSLKEFAHSGEHPMEHELVQELLEQKGIKEVVNDTIEIVKENDSSVLPAIKSAIKSMIESAIRLGTLDSADKDNLEKQMKIVDRLGEMLTKSFLGTEELKLVTEVFSKYQSKVKGILDDYAQNPEKYPKQPTLSQRMSRSRSVSSLFSRGENHKGYRRLSESSASSVETELSLDGKEPATVNPNGLRGNLSSSNLNGSSEHEEANVPKMSASPTRSNSVDNLASNDGSIASTSSSFNYHNNSDSEMSSVSTDDSKAGLLDPDKPKATGLFSRAAGWVLTKATGLFSRAAGWVLTKATGLFSRVTRLNKENTVLEAANSNDKHSTVTRSDSPDSGMDSPGSSTPTEQSLSSKEEFGKEFKEVLVKQHSQVPLEQHAG